MTRPKSVRQVGRNPFARLPVLNEARVPLSPKYALEMAIYDAGGNTALWLGWDPHPPSQAEEDELSDRIDEALAPFFHEAYARAGLLERGAS